MGLGSGEIRLGEIIEALRRSTVQVRTGQNGAGSGVIWSRDGRIITNAHVVAAEHPLPVEVELWDGTRLPGRVVHRDRRRDLASIQVAAQELPAASPGDSQGLRVGELVVAVGNPLGFTGAASTGVVHQLNWTWDRSANRSRRPWIVSQLRLAPGNSGGPLATAEGKVVGINTMISGGLAFAVPSCSVMAFVDSIVAARTYRDGLGVLAAPVQFEPSRFGFALRDVFPGSPAENVSLRAGDTLLAANGLHFRSDRDLEAAVLASRGTLLRLDFRRGSSAGLRTVSVPLESAVPRAA